MKIDEMDEALDADPTIAALELSAIDWWALKEHQDARPNNEPGWARGGLTHRGVLVGIGHLSRVWTEAEWREVWGVLAAEFEMQLPRDKRVR